MKMTQEFWTCYPTKRRSRTTLSNNRHRKQQSQLWQWVGLVLFSSCGMSLFYVRQFRALREISFLALLDNQNNHDYNIGHPNGMVRYMVSDHDRDRTQSVHSNDDRPEQPIENHYEYSSRIQEEEKEMNPKQQTMRDASTTGGNDDTTKNNGSEVTTPTVPKQLQKQPHSSSLRGRRSKNKSNEDKRFHRMHPFISTTTLASYSVKKGKVQIEHRQFSQDRPSLHLIGERHSGTNWMEQQLLNCFNGTVDVFFGYSAWKHWFQAENTFFDNDSSTGTAVVVAQFRNVYHWTKAMQTVPYHSPKHYYKPWKKFVSQPWTMPRYDQDLELLNIQQKQFHHHHHNNNKNDTDTTIVLNQQNCPRDLTCHQGEARHRDGNKRPYEIIPCLATNDEFRVGRKPSRAFYELRNDGSGLPFANILELRAAKIRNFLSMAKFSNVRQLHPVRYEAVMRNGTLLVALMQRLERDLNVTAHCHLDKLRQQQGDSTRPYGKRKLQREFVKHLQRHVDWDAEALVGYHPDDIYGTTSNDDDDDDDDDEEE